MRKRENAGEAKLPPWVLTKDAANIRWVFVIRHIRQFFQFSRIFVIRYFWKI
jgi:hypothetical protein